MDQLITTNEFYTIVFPIILGSLFIITSVLKFWNNFNIQMRAVSISYKLQAIICCPCMNSYNSY